MSRAREELEALAGEPVAEVTGTTALDDPAVARCSGTSRLIGTEALLHRVGRADAVAFLDFDQELLARGYLRRRTGAGPARAGAEGGAPGPGRPRPA